MQHYCISLGSCSVKCQGAWAWLCVLCTRRCPPPCASCGTPRACSNLSNSTMKREWWSGKANGSGRCVVSRSFTVTSTAFTVHVTPLRLRIVLHFAAVSQSSPMGCASSSSAVEEPPTQSQKIVSPPATPQPAKPADAVKPADIALSEARQESAASTASVNSQAPSSIKEKGPVGLGALIAAGPPPGRGIGGPRPGGSASVETVSTGTAPPVRQRSATDTTLEFATLERAAPPRKRKPATRKHAASLDGSAPES